LRVCGFKQIYLACHSHVRRNFFLTMTGIITYKNTDILFWITLYGTKYTPSPLTSDGVSMWLRENNCNDFINHAQEAWDQIYGRWVSVILVALSYKELISGVCVLCVRACVCVGVCDSASLVEQKKKTPLNATCEGNFAWKFWHACHRLLGPAINYLYNFFQEYLLGRKYFPNFQRVIETFSLNKCECYYLHYFCHIKLWKWRAMLLELSISAFSLNKIIMLSSF
jgi:hypothetical protein